MDKITFVLTACNSMPHLKVTIDSLLASTTYPFEIVIVESESTDGTTEYVSYLEKTMDNATVLFTKREGTIKAINAGIRVVTDDSHVFLCHDDIYFFKWYRRDWLDIFMRLLKSNSQAGMIIPINGGGVSGSDYVKDLKWAGTWSTLINKDIIKKFGKENFLDENFGKGYGDDIDMSYRVMKEGYRLAIAPFWIDHHRLSEHKNDQTIKDIEKLKKKNSAYFRKKWGIKQ